MPSVSPMALRPFSPMAACVMRCRMRDQRLDSAQRLAHGAQPHPLQQALGVGQRAGLEGDHRAEARHLPASQFILRMVLQSGIEDLLHLAMAAKDSRP